MTIATVNRKVFSSFFVFATIVLFLTPAFSATMRWCVKWKTCFADAGQGEDYDTSNLCFYYRWAPYAMYKLRNKSTNQEWTGFLGSNACTSYLPVTANTEYEFIQYTWIKRDNRQVVVQFDGSPGWGGYALGIYTDHSIGAVSGNMTKEVKPNYSSPQQNVARVAGLMMTDSASIGFPNNTTTYVQTWGDYGHGAYNEGSAGIFIDDNFTYIPGPPPTVIDMSTYKFIIGHELGHRQALLTNMPFSGSYSDQCPENAYCNCNHHNGNWDSGCLQSREFINTAQSEGYAFFYSAAIQNTPTSGSCKIGYWRSMYDPVTLQLKTVPPYPFDCAARYRWMGSRGCALSDRGVVSDWTAFFWNMWTTDEPSKYTIAEFQDIWSQTPSTFYYGQLLATLYSKYGSTSHPKYQQFTFIGNQTGVNY